MTCSTMIDRMLEADLEELSGRGDTVLARHLQACARCSAVAGQLVRDTDDLARVVAPSTVQSVAVPARRTRAIVPRARLAILAGIAATLSIMLLREGERATPEPRVATVVMQPSYASSPAPLPAPTRISRHASRASAVALPTSRPTRQLGRPAPTSQSIVPVTVTVEPTRADPVERAVAVAPVRLDPAAPTLPLGIGVSVDPPAGKRANIIHTDRPGVTVVWLY